MRSFYRQIKSLRLTSIPKEFKKGAYTQKLASCLRARIRLERFLRDDQYISPGKLCVENIMQCIQGKHTDCREKSVACEAHMPSYSTKSLPYGKHITLSYVDIDNIRSMVSKYVSTDCLKESLARLSTTNQCESLHSQLFRWAPKHTGWSRNFTGLCHSVTHSASLGTGASMVITAQLLGLPVSNRDPFYQFATKLDMESRYRGRRQASFKYKSLRHVRRRQKNNRKLLQLSAYGTDPQIDVEQYYGLNPVD